MRLVRRPAAPSSGTPTDPTWPLSWESAAMTCAMPSWLRWLSSGSLDARWPTSPMRHAG
jgi:hypothetical protein